MLNSPKEVDLIWDLEISQDLFGFQALLGCEDGINFYGGIISLFAV